MKAFRVILFIFLFLNSSRALPKPQGENEEATTQEAVTETEVGPGAEENTVKVDDDAEVTEVPGDEDDDTTSLEKGDAETTTTTKKTKTEVTDEQPVLPTIAVSVTPPVTKPVPSPGSGEENLDPIIIDPPTKPAEDEDPNGECGPACKLAAQAPLIIFIGILVAIILLLIILFGCYFMKKLHGKAILTANKSLPNQQPSEFTHRTLFDSKAVVVEPVVSGAQKIITTTTTKVTKSVGGAFADVSL